MQTSKKGNTTGMKPAQKPSKTALKKARKAERLSLSLEEASFGPFGMKGFSMSSRNSSMVGLGTRALNIQRVMPRITSRTRSNGNTVDVLTGTDFLVTVASGGSGNLSGDVLVHQDISPSLLAATRLFQFSGLYQRYRFTKVNFLYEPVANATQSGQVLGFCDFDVDSPLTEDNPQNLSVGAAHQGQAITQIWEPAVFSMGQSLTFTDLFTDVEGEDPRLSIQGTFYLLAASEIPMDLPLGNIYVEYEVEFSIPNLSTFSIVSQENSANFAYAVMPSQASGSVPIYATGSPITDPTTFTQYGFGPMTSSINGSDSQMTYHGTYPGSTLYYTIILTGAICSNTLNSSVAFNDSAGQIYCGGGSINEFVAESFFSARVSGATEFVQVWQGTITVTDATVTLVPYQNTSAIQSLSGVEGLTSGTLQFSVIQVNPPLLRGRHEKPTLPVGRFLKRRHTRDDIAILRKQVEELTLRITAPPRTLSIPGPLTPCSRSVSRLDRTQEAPKPECIKRSQSERLYRPGSG